MPYKYRHIHGGTLYAMLPNAKHSRACPATAGARALLLASVLRAWIFQFPAGLPSDEKEKFRVRTECRDDDLVGNQKRGERSHCQGFWNKYFLRLALKRWQNISFKTRRA